ncbi:MAG: hypothetical protein GVY30_13125 [Chloroflexi bacterium]|jgi:hypothetical protein|nr:hypothetical protein [Chloroflexota bacterium]
MNTIRQMRGLSLIIAALLCAIWMQACTPAPTTVSPMTPPSIQEAEEAEGEGGVNGGNEGEASAGGNLVLSDSFAPPHTGWVRFETADSAVYAQAGEMFLEDRGAGSSVYTPLVGESHQDVTVAARLRYVQGAVDNWMGVICRQQDEENYYLFGISADGYYVILRTVKGVATPLVGPHASDVINVGKAENDMRVRCRDNKLSLWVNGTLLVSRVDEELMGSGAVALFTDAIEPGRTTTVAFDDVTITAP